MATAPRAARFVNPHEQKDDHWLMKQSGTKWEDVPDVPEGSRGGQQTREGRWEISADSFLNTEYE